MTATPGRPEDWADTNPESTTPERILPTPEGVTPSATKVAMVCYAVGAASMCWERPERAGVFDSDRASQIVTELCVALGVEQQGDAAPESARPATLTPEQPVKAPGQDGDIFLTRGTVVEADWPTSSRLLHYVDEGGYQLTAEDVGNGSPYSWGLARIVRVFTEDKPTQEPVLPRRIKPEDVRVGMMVERRKGEAAHRDRVQQIDGDLIVGSPGRPYLWVPGHGVVGWSLWLIEDAPAPVDPDAEATDADTEDVVYLSGPMTGLPDFNRPAFHAAAAALRAQGHVVINPAEVDLGPDATWADYMRIHLAEIARRVTQVFVLPGWESSRGAQLEVHVARALGLPVVPVPAPEDPDAELVERMAKEVHDRNCADVGCRDWDGHGESTRKAWREDARVVIRNLRAQGFDVTARAEQ